MSILAAVSNSDLSVLFVLLALVAFGFAVYLAVRGAIAAAIVAAFVGVVILVVA